MITLTWYLLKVIICSGILCGYYYIALRNKIFHRWNRFYLLAAVVVSFAVPIMKINIFRDAANSQGAVVQMLRTINSSDEIIIEYSRHNGLQLSSQNSIIAAYLLVTIVFLAIFVLALYKIRWLKRKYPEVKMKDISFISTDAKGTPFSFFKSIFWNNAIDLHSRQGQQIFNHEIAHVKEKHSYDKIFMNVVLIFSWMNPFFWLIRKELSMIHEFIADKESLEDDDVNAFAEMILQTVYPGQNFLITNNFFHSPLKRRLIMFTKNKNPRISYLSRLLVLPLIAIVFFAFTLKMKKIDPINHYNGKKITVVIDAGHGGSDNGAVADNINEKDLTLAIAKEVKELNKNQNLNIILSRDRDVTMPVKDRTEFTNERKADLFISIHVDADANKSNLRGLTVLIPKNENRYVQESQLLGSAIIQSFQNNYQLPITKDLQQLQQGVWVLKESECPAVLVETGFITNEKDLNYLLDPKNQAIVAKNILNGIEKYANEKSGNNGTTAIQDVSISAINDSLPDALYVTNGKIISKNDAKKIDPNEIQSMNILKGEDAIKKYGNNGKNGVIEINKKIQNENGKSTVKPEPLYVIDGKESSKDVLGKISPSSIESVSVLKDETAIKKYGQKGKNGVVEINLKSIDAKSVIDNSKNDTIPDKVFTKVENEASFPGGQQAWVKYIVTKIQASVDSFTNKDYGTCVVKFIVNTDGTISNVEATTMKDTHLAKTAMNAIKTGPKWIPATQNGQTVAAYRLQPVTLTNPEKK